MITVQLVNNHQHVDITERHKTQGENPQRPNTLVNQVLLIRAEETGHFLREKPDADTRNEHGNRDESERLAYNHLKRFVIAFAHLYGAERLHGAASA